MKKEIKKELIKMFERKFGHPPHKKELKRLDYLAFLYEKDMRYILKMEIREFEISKNNIEVGEGN